MVLRKLPFHIFDTLNGTSPTNDVSCRHSFGEKFSKSQWMKEIHGQREILSLYGGVKMEDVRGMRAPFLQIGGNKMFEMLHEANFTYDSSMPVFDNNPPFWPYTLDFAISHECMIGPCPTKSYPGVWEVGKYQMFFVNSKF